MSKPFSGTLIFLIHATTLSHSEAWQGHLVCIYIYIYIYTHIHIPRPAINIDTRYLTKKCKLLVWFEKNCAQFITDIMNYTLQKNYSKLPPFAWTQRRNLLGHSSIAVRMTSIGKLTTASTSACFNYSRLWWHLVRTRNYSQVDKFWAGYGQWSLLINLHSWFSSHCYVVLALCGDEESCWNIHCLFWIIV